MAEVGNEYSMDFQQDPEVEQESSGEEDLPAGDAGSDAASHRETKEVDPTRSGSPDTQNEQEVDNDTSQEQEPSQLWGSGGSVHEREQAPEQPKPSTSVATSRENSYETTQDQAPGDARAGASSSSSLQYPPLQKSFTPPHVPPLHNLPPPSSGSSPEASSRPGSSQRDHPTTLLQQVSRHSLLSSTSSRMHSNAEPSPRSTYDAPAHYGASPKLQDEPSSFAHAAAEAAEMRPSSDRPATQVSSHSQAGTSARQVAAAAAVAAAAPAPPAAPAAPAAATAEAVGAGTPTTSATVEPAAAAAQDEKNAGTALMGPGYRQATMVQPKQPLQEFKNAAQQHVMTMFSTAHSSNRGIRSLPNALDPDFRQRLYQEILEAGQRERLGQGPVKQETWHGASGAGPPVPPLSSGQKQVARLHPLAGSFTTFEYMPSEYGRQKQIVKLERLQNKLAQVTATDFVVKAPGAGLRGAPAFSNFQYDSNPLEALAARKRAEEQANNARVLAGPFLAGGPLDPGTALRGRVDECMFSICKALSRDWPTAFLQVFEDKSGSIVTSFDKMCAVSEGDLSAYMHNMAKFNDIVADYHLSKDCNQWGIVDVDTQTVFYVFWPPWARHRNAATTRHEPTDQAASQPTNMSSSHQQGASSINQPLDVHSSAQLESVTSSISSMHQLYGRGYSQRHNPAAVTAAAGSAELAGSLPHLGSMNHVGAVNASPKQSADQQLPALRSVQGSMQWGFASESVAVA